MLIFLNLLVSFTLIFTTGNGQKVDLSKQKDLILKLHNGYRGLQGASNMKKMVRIYIYYINVKDMFLHKVSYLVVILACNFDLLRSIQFISVRFSIFRFRIDI